MVADRDRADRRAAFAALLSAAFMIAQQVGSKATRDALFLSSFDATDLPRVVIAAAAASMVAVLVASRGYARFGPAKVVPIAFAVSAVLYVAEWFLQAQAPRAVAVALYLHTAIFGALVISGFWSVVNERFDPHSAKTVVSRIGMGATVGGVAGGLVAYQVGEQLDAAAMLLALAGLNAIAAIGVSRIGTLGPPPVASPTANAVAVLKKEPYLQTLVAMVLLTAISAGLLDYAFKATAADHFQQGSGALLSFFAIFHVVAAILSLLMQAGLAKPALEKLGVAGSVATLPLIVLVTAAVAAGVTQLISVVIARAGELVMANSIFRSGYELLYTPVAPDKKRPTKTLIDVAGNRIGDAVGNGLVLVVVLITDRFAIEVVLGLAVAFAALTLWAARRLHKGYVGQLEQSLRSGTPMEAEAVLLQRAATLSTLGLDRELLFEQLAAHQSWGERLSMIPTGSTSTDGTDNSEPREPDGIDAPDEDPVHDAAHVLRRGDSAAIREVLSEPLDARLTQHAIALLARRDVYKTAQAALRDIVGEDDVEQHLVAALTDPEQPFAIRRRLPKVLEASTSAHVADGLTRGLDDNRFEVRYRCAIALARICAREESYRPSIERVHEVVRRELETGKKAWDTRRLLDADDTEEDAPLIDRAIRQRIHRSVEYVFTLLSLAYDPEPLRLSLFALAGEDKLLRGTALEYLENVLPEEIRDALFPMLDVRVEIHKKRSREEIVDDLVMRSLQAMDKGSLEKAIAQHRKRQAESKAAEAAAAEDEPDE